MHHRYLDKMCSLKRANDAFFQVATPPLGARTRPKRGRGRERERETFIDNQEVTEGGSHRLWALGHTVQAWAMVHLVLHFKERPKLRVDHRHRHLPARGSVCVESLFQHSQSLSREYPDGEYASPKNRNQGPNVFGSMWKCLHAQYTHASTHTHTNAANMLPDADATGCCSTSGVMGFLRLFEFLRRFKEEAESEAPWPIGDPDGSLSSFSLDLSLDLAC